MEVIDHGIFNCYSFTKGNLCHQQCKGNSWIVVAQLIFFYAVIQEENSDMGMEEVVTASGKVTMPSNTK